ncbi:hypothetical protein [Streptomyces sp. NPDC017435]|uniref:hypothetical protein n=1 Tax=Streptomyces sp. NPDC017435 TaxID=3364995 RepID=UPI0037BC33B5
MTVEEVTPAEGAVRLREMLRGPAAASESRFMRGLRQGREQGVLVGAALHAAERSRQGKAPTDLERVLLKALGDLMPQADVHACGQEYRSAVADLGALDIVPASVTSRPLTSGYTLADFKARLPVIGREAVTLPNAAIVDPAALADGRPIDSAEFTEGLTEFGYGATVFNRPPVPSEERGKPVPGYRAKVEFDSFYVRRAVGDQWGGKDEIYWTVAAASDKHKARTYKSGESGRPRPAGRRSPVRPIGKVDPSGQTGWECWRFLEPAVDGAQSEGAAQGDQQGELTLVGADGLIGDDCAKAVADDDASVVVKVTAYFANCVCADIRFVEVSHNLAQGLVQASDADQACLTEPWDVVERGNDAAADRADPLDVRAVDSQRFQFEPCVTGVPCLGGIQGVGEPFETDLAGCLKVFWAECGVGTGLVRREELSAVEGHPRNPRDALAHGPQPVGQVGVLGVGHAACKVGQPMRIFSVAAPG